MSETSNGAAMNGQGHGTTANGRDSGGRFTAGNRGGPGNPFARRSAALRKAVQEAVTPDMMAAVAGVVFQRALGGDLSAARLLFSYGIGRPGPSPDPDTLDAHDLAVRRGSTASPEDMKALFEKLPAGLLCAVAAVVAPQIQAHLEQAFADGVRRQGESEERDSRVAPEAPGPYHGRKADWAPSWLKEGLPKEVEELFDSCPAWMPDYYGTDKPAHAYGKMLQALSRDLLATLDGQCRLVSGTDSKRDKPHGSGRSDGASALSGLREKGEVSSAGLPGPGRTPRTYDQDGAGGPAANECQTASEADGKRDNPHGPAARAVARADDGPGT